MEYPISVKELSAEALARKVAETDFSFQLKFFIAIAGFYSEKSNNSQKLNRSRISSCLYSLSKIIELAVCGKIEDIKKIIKRVKKKT